MNKSEDTGQTATEAIGEVASDEVLVSDEQRQPPIQMNREQTARTDAYRNVYSNRSSQLFMVPPYVEDEDFGGTNPPNRGNVYSFNPLIIQSPAQALVDRLDLPGSFLFDEEAERRRDVPALDFPGELFALGSMATLGVGAGWSTSEILAAREAWRANGYLPNSLHRQCCDLAAYNDWPGSEFFDAIDRTIRPIPGLGGMARLSKAMALARPGDFPMLDKFITQVLVGFDKSLPSYYYWSWWWPSGVWMALFQILLRALLPSLAGIKSPQVRNVSFNYSALEKLDRLLWLGRYAFEAPGFSTSLGPRWTRITSILSTQWDGFLRDVPAGLRPTVEASLPVWVPREDPDDQSPPFTTPTVAYPSITGTLQGQRVDDVLRRASILAQRYRYVP